VGLVSCSVLYSRFRNLLWSSADYPEILATDRTLNTVSYMLYNVSIPPPSLVVHPMYNTSKKGLKQPNGGRMFSFGKDEKEKIEGVLLCLGIDTKLGAMVYGDAAS
jgi:hypothetical protein